MATDGAGPAGTAATSTWAPLRIGVFRGLFIAALTSNIGTWMQTVGAQWFLVERHASPTVIALVQTARLPLLPETGDEQLAPGGQSGHLST